MYKSKREWDKGSIKTTVKGITFMERSPKLENVKFTLFLEEIFNVFIEIPNFYIEMLHVIYFSINFIKNYIKKLIKFTKMFHKTKIRKKLKK